MENKTHNACIEPEELWLNPEISGEQLVHLDPCRETDDLLRLAEFITPLDAFIEGLPERPPTLRQDAIWFRQMRKPKPEVAAGECLQRNPG